jgi:3-oxoacyl-[acyl-carrier protein] reductase
LAKEVAPNGINVNCICPGVIKTDMLNIFNEETLKALENEIPLKRLGTPEDVAKAAAFLASEEASYITGTVLNINGGYVM